MQIQVALYANLDRFLPPGASGRKAALDVPEGSTIADVIRRLAIPPEMMALTFVNGTQASHDTVLRAGDLLEVFAPLTGGRRPADRSRSRAEAAPLR